MPYQDVIQIQIGAPHFKYTDPDQTGESARRRARQLGIQNGPAAQENPE